MNKVEAALNHNKVWSAIQEKTIADFLGWSVVSGRGSRACMPGDVVSANWLGECKTHGSTDRPIHFNANVWKKISDEAAARGKYPVLFVDDGSQDINKTWCMFRYTSISPDDLVLNFNACPDMIEKHLNFKHTELFEIYQLMKDGMYSDRYVAFYVPWDVIPGNYVAVTPLVEFKRMFEE